VHVRPTHVHVVVRAERTPERVMNAFKAYASHEMNARGLDNPERKRWTRHGSTRYLWKRENVEAAVDYVVQNQGNPMAVFDSRAGSPAAAPDNLLATSHPE